MRPVDMLFPKCTGLRSEYICPMCKKPVDTKSFTDELSKTEFTLSGLCQQCQDKVFKYEE